MNDPFTPGEPRDKSGSQGVAKGTRTRRPYRKPQLVEYGSVAKLTQGTRTAQSDGVGGGFKMSCL